ncbi:thiamine diphosphokinase [Inediibacterium massiliense]|uniref:thiamine diphosphokinase n=1 Tax=Inediibacterium massiliense TaxID=1658111 RepID=UPI0006B6937E|nr:thiamine diphosphokinase [Inediibacterium massiliense]
MRCVIVTNGEILHYESIKNKMKDYDFLICADGGAKHLLKMDLVPHFIVGDLDSIDEEVKKYFQEKKVIFYKFPKEKDYTDTELAVEYALQKGATEILFLGAIGSRMDHTLANVTLLVDLLKKGIKAKIINEQNEIIATNKNIEIEGEKGEYLSIIPLCEKVEGITLKGLKYPLFEATISMGSSIGISNEFKEKKARIEIKKGIILIIKAKDKSPF